MRFDVDPFGSAITQEQETKQKEREKEKEKLDRQSAEYRDGLRAGQREAQRRKEPFTSEDKETLARRLEELKAKGEALTNEDKAKLALLRQALEARADTLAVEDELKLARQMEELKARDEMHAGLVRLARIPMDQAIQIATSQFPGKVLQSSLGAKGWERPGQLAPGGAVFYHVTIITEDEGSPTLTHVWVNAVDGTIMKNEKELPRKLRSREREEP